jgi:hypothetical protein
MTNEANNVDALLVQVTNQQLSQQQAQPAPQQDAVDTAPLSSPEPVIHKESVNSSSDPYIPAQAQEEHKNVPQGTLEQDTSDSKNGEVDRESPIDDYGNPIEKPKMYSEDEVQRMMRDRLSRMKNYEPTTKQINQDAKDFKPNPESEESWEVQLEQFIDRRMEARERERTEREWREIEARKQSDFEARFSSGMNKYSDFEKVVSGKPITNDMMMATRSLENPAAFIYAAAKMHPQELERIAKIPDGYQQASEVGRLHERMIKNRIAHTSAAKPLEPLKGDLPPKTQPAQKSLEQRIHEHAEQKRKR